MVEKDAKSTTYGGGKFTSVDQYHQAFDGIIRKRLDEMREALKEALPHAEDVISYNMPSFKQKKALVYYAAAKGHIGFYPTPGPITAFADALTSYKTSKGAIQFPLDHKLPAPLIKAIARFRLQIVMGTF